MPDFRLELPQGHGIIATLDEAGIVTFAILAGKESAIRGAEMIDLMMRAFAGRVHAIRGVWRKGAHGLPSANIDKVNELTASGVTIDEAVVQTWTALQAARWGYSRIGQLTAEGEAGSYFQVDVLFQKESES